MLFMKAFEVMLIMSAVYPRRHITKLGAREIIFATLSSIPLLFILVPCAVLFVISVGHESIIKLTDMLYSSALFACLFAAYIMIAARQIRIRNLISSTAEMVEISECSLGSQNVIENLKDFGISGGKYDEETPALYQRCSDQLNKGGVVFSSE